MCSWKIEIENLETKRSHDKATHAYIIQKDQSPLPLQMWAPPLQNSMIVTTTIILAILKLIYYFQGKKLISSNTI